MKIRKAMMPVQNISIQIENEMASLESKLGKLMGLKPEVFRDGKDVVRVYDHEQLKTTLKAWLSNPVKCSVKFQDLVQPYLCLERMFMAGQSFRH